MKLNTAALAIAVMACTAIAKPDADASTKRPWSKGVVGAYNMKRAAYDINDILKRHAEAKPVCNEPYADSVCEKHRRALDDIAEVALDGYDEVSQRESKAAPKNKLPGGRFDGKTTVHLTKHCDESDHCLPARSAAPESRLAKRRCSLCPPNACPLWMKQACLRVKEASLWRSAHKPTKTVGNAYHTGADTKLKGITHWCGAPGSPNCAIWKRQDLEAAQPFGKAIREVSDAVQKIKRDVETLPLEDDGDDFYAVAESYFQELESRVDAAVAGLNE